MDDWIRVFRAKSEEYEYRLKVKRDTRARESYVRKEEIEQKIRSAMDLELLTEWHKLAAKAGSMEEFIGKM